MHHSKMIQTLFLGLTLSTFPQNTVLATQESQEEWHTFLKEGRIASHDSCLSKQDKKKLYASYKAHLGQTHIPAQDRLLHTAKCLDLSWNGQDAREFARMSHDYLAKDAMLSGEERTRVAYQGFACLGIHFDEPDYDYHKKLGATFEVLLMLESLKESTKSLKTKSKLPFLDFPIRYFGEQDIPHARVCELLMVAYGLYPAFSGDNTFDYEGRIYENGHKAFTLYQSALEGATTPDQRTHYHNKILTLGHELATRVPADFLTHVTYYQPLIQKSAKFLAREQKDALDEIDSKKNPLAWCLMKKKLGISLHYANKNDKALQHLQDVVDFQLHEDFHKTELELLLQKIKVRTQGNVIAFSDPSKIFDHQMKNISLYWGQ